MADEQPQTPAVNEQLAPAAPAQSAEATTQPVPEVEPVKSSEPAEKSEENQGTTSANGVEQAEASEQPGAAAAEQAEQADTTQVDTTEVGEGTSAPKPVSTPATGKKGGVTRAPSTKKNQKKKPAPVLNLNCQPGQHYWARLKGHPLWPAIICDEDMLPDVLLASRPVSAARPDGTLREDFKEGGKNAKDRTYAVMFLQTNEFSWMNNTALTPLDPEECRTPPKGKSIKSLAIAYELAAESHDIDYYKDLLRKFHEEEKELEAMRLAQLEELEEEERQKAEAKAAEGADGKKKKKARKSKGGDDGDVDMADADAPKSSKKRKKGEESDGEGLKPKKTPKLAKLNGPKTPNGEASTAKKPKKKVQAPSSDETDEKPQMTEAERMANREKAVLYLRHRLQKGFLARDEQPKEAEMATMAEFFTQLESYTELEPAIIRNTKIHKVLKAMVKLSSIPKEEEFNFKKRSSAMLETWNKRMEADTGAGEAKPAAASTGKVKAETNGDTPAAESAPATNGTSRVEAKAEEAAEKIEEKVEEEAPKSTEPTAAPAAVDADAPAREAKDKDGDVAIEDAPAPAPAADTEAA